MTNHYSPLINSLQKLLLATIIIVSTAGFMFSQEPEWQNITPMGWSGNFRAMADAGNGKIVALSDSGCIYHSLDTGLTWVPLHKMRSGASIRLFKIAFHPDKQYGAVICDNSIAYTTDNGVSWNTGRTSDLGQFMPKNLYWKSEDTLLCVATYVAEGSDIFMSTDHGYSWTRKSDLQWGGYVAHFRCIHFASKSHGFMFSQTYRDASFNNYAETTDGGNTWTSKTFYVNNIESIINYDDGTSVIAGPQFNEALHEMFPGLTAIPSSGVGTLIDGRRDGIFYTTSLSSYAGFYERNLNTNTTTEIEVESYKYIYCGIFLDADKGVMAGRGLTLYRTTDGGTTWTKIIHGGADGLNTIHCKDRNECFVGGKKGRLFNTKDGGATWTWQDIHDEELLEIEFPTPDTGYISANRTLFRTTDGGSSWEQFSHNTDGRFIEFPTKDIGYIGYSTGTPIIEKTENAFESSFFVWDLTYLDNKSMSSAFCFRDSQVGLTTGRDKLLFTTDGGSTWNTKDIDLGGGFANIIIDIDGEDWLVSNSGRIYKCDNDFNCTLKYSEEDRQYYSFGYKNGIDMLYIVTVTDSLIISYDKGETWGKTKDSIIYKAFFPELNVAYNTNLYGTIFYKRFTTDLISCESLVFTSDSQLIVYFSFNSNSINGTIYIRNKEGIVVQSEIVTLSHNNYLTIPLNSNIINDSGYTLEFVPHDTLLYNVVVSEPFSIGGDSTAVEKIIQEPFYKQQGNKISSKCHGASLYNVLGQQLYGNLPDEIQLPSGIYIIRCGSEAHNIVVE